MTRLAAGMVIVAAIGVALAAARGESSSRSSWVLLALDGGAPADGPTRLAARHGPDRPLVDLAPGFAVARDADVSPDGGRVVFAGRRAETDPWSLWEVSATGSGLRQLRLDREAREPAYLDEARVVYAGRVEDEWALFVHGPSSTDRVTPR